jgi:hypothetical protein
MFLTDVYLESQSATMVARLRDYVHITDHIGLSESIRTNSVQLYPLTLIPDSGNSIRVEMATEWQIMDICLHYRVYRA